MSTEKNNNQFREDEIVIMSHVDKRTGEVVTRPYPKVGGRLRLAHEENGNLSISTEIIRYEENVAVVRALATTKKGYFNGLGMASLERDQQIAPALGRSLRTSQGLFRFPEDRGKNGHAGPTGRPEKGGWGP